MVFTPGQQLLAAETRIATQKAFRRVFTRFERLDVMYLAVLTLALIVEALR
jgi:hypothetical protein